MPSVLNSGIIDTSALVQDSIYRTTSQCQVHMPTRGSVTAGKAGLLIDYYQSKLTSPVNLSSALITKADLNTSVSILNTEMKTPILKDLPPLGLVVNAENLFSIGYDLSTLQDQVLDVNRIVTQRGF